MWVTTALLIQGCLCQHFIQIKNKDFIGEDTVLSRELMQRLGNVSTQIELAQMPQQYQSNVRVHEQFKRSRLPNARRYFYEPPEKALKDRTMDIMQHHVYVTQYRMQHLKTIADSYAADVRFRVAYIYCQLDTFIQEMRIMYTLVNRTLEKRYWEQMKVHQILIYYTYFLKKNIDITYIVEHMIAIHTRFMTDKSGSENPYKYVPPGEDDINTPPAFGRPPAQAAPNMPPRPSLYDGAKPGNPVGMYGGGGNMNPVGPGGGEGNMNNFGPGGGEDFMSQPGPGGEGNMNPVGAGGGGGNMNNFGPGGEGNMNPVGPIGEQDSKYPRPNDANGPSGDNEGEGGADAVGPLGN